jgi:hypothetical protein
LGERLVSGSVGLGDGEVVCGKRERDVGVRGVERYYGFLGGENNQRHPDLVYDDHYIVQPYSSWGTSCITAAISWASRGRSLSPLRWCLLCYNTGKRKKHS